MRIGAVSALDPSGISISLDPNDPTSGIPYQEGNMLDCYPSNFVGPLPPGATYCATGTQVNPNAGPLGVSNSGVSTSNWIMLAALGVGLLILGTRR